MKKLPVLFYLILLLPGTRLSAQEFEYNTRCQQAYQAIFKLKITEGNQLLFKEKQLNKDNLLPYFLENYGDFLALYISEDEALYKKLSGNKDERLRILQAGNPKSPYFLYTQANLYLQWAFTKIKFGDYLSAVWDVRKAYNLLKTNKEKFPSFAPNNKDLALLNTLFGAIPDKYKFGARILGLKGDIDEGLKEMARLLKDPKMPFGEEATIMYTMMVLHLGKNKEGALKMLDQLGLDLDDNLLNHFIVASVSHYTGRNNQVIEVLSNRPSGKEYFAFPYLDYMIGIAKLNRLDRDSDIYLKKFLASYKGKNYIREANRKLAWHALIFNKKDLYNEYMKKILLTGNASVDEDKAATREAESRKTPNLLLLKARLLSDGAYYTRALDVLEELNPRTMNEEEEVLEFYYRKARIYDEMGQFDKAVPLYEQTIKEGGNTTLYYAPNSCIKLGNYYERRGNKVQASAYYKKALNYTDHEYKNSIDAQAKAGLNRIQ